MFKSNVIINNLFVVVVSFEFLCFVCAQDNLKIGDSCIVEEKNVAGTCKLFEDCQRAIIEKENNKTSQICGHQGDAPIVCCPNVGEITEKNCQKYGLAVYEVKFSDTFLIRRRKVNVSTCINEGTTFVIGGVDAKEKEFPHMALLGYGTQSDKKWLCGGSLISEQFVLTAGHCLSWRTYGKVRWVRLGELNKAETVKTHREEFEVKNIIKHPSYRRNAKYHDIALLQLDKEVNFSPYLRPACLNTLTSLDISAKLIATGWGLQENGGSLSDTLQKVAVDQYTQEECFRAYEKDINSTRKYLTSGIVSLTQMCAGGRDAKKDTCVGDSGGPLQIYHKNVYCMLSIVGVTSFGKQVCGIVGTPGVYTRVSSYLEWIENTVWI